MEKDLEKEEEEKGHEGDESDNGHHDHEDHDHHHSGHHKHKKHHKQCDMTTTKKDVIFKSTVTKSNLMCGFIPSSPRLALISVLIKSISVYVCCSIGKIEITLSIKRYETLSIISF